MSVPVRSLVFIGLFAASALIPCAAVLHAQEVTDLPATGNSSPSVQKRVTDTIEGIKSGDVSAAKKAAEFDNFLSYTFIRISDCWTLCKQEMILAGEYARQETIQAARDMYKKGVDAATEQGREAILDKLPEFVSPENNGASGD